MHRPLGLMLRDYKNRIVVSCSHCGMTMWSNSKAARVLENGSTIVCVDCLPEGMTIAEKMRGARNWAKRNVGGVGLDALLRWMNADKDSKARLERFHKAMDTLGLDTMDFFHDTGMDADRHTLAIQERTKPANSLGY